MGKGTDKLYITHSEWASEDAYSAAAGSGVSKARGAADDSFKRLPFDYCALSLQPFSNPVCTPEGTVFDAARIAAWLETHDTNPVDGLPLAASDLIKLNFAKNADGEYVDPVSSKVFTNSSHIVALRTTGNVFNWDSVHRFNVMAKNWTDLVSGESFSRKDVITLQDPRNIESRNYSAFKFLKDGEDANVDGQDLKTGEDSAPQKLIKAKEAVEKARAERRKDNEQQGMNAVAKKASALTMSAAVGSEKSTPYNAARHTTGKAAASFTSTGVTPYTSNEMAVLTDEEYMLKPRRIKFKGYSTIHTNHGDLNLELYPEYAPKAVWNFVQLAKKGYYKGINFHRNIRGFMIQGGDPTGTGRGGSSIWNKNFEDEFEGPLKHDGRGVLSMANKGKNTNSSQFFLTYRGTTHLDRKHTIFGRLIEGHTTLDKLEQLETNEKDRPLKPIKILNVEIVVDPFEEFQKQRSKNEQDEKEKARIKAEGGTEDDKTTWTGKRIRQDGKIIDSTPAVGKYLKTMTDNGAEDGLAGAHDAGVSEEPSSKKVKRAGGFNFDSW